MKGGGLWGEGGWNFRQVGMPAGGMLPEGGRAWREWKGSGGHLLLLRWSSPGNTMFGDGLGGLDEMFLVYFLCCLGMLAGVMCPERFDRPGCFVWRRRGYGEGRG